MFSCLWLTSSVDDLQISCFHVWCIASVVRSVANYGILFGWCESRPNGRNVLYCMCRFNAALSDVVSAPTLRSLMLLFGSTLLSTSLMSRNSLSVCYVECIMLWDSVLTLPNVFTVTDIEHIITSSFITSNCSTQNTTHKIHIKHTRIKMSRNGQ